MAWIESHQQLLNHPKTLRLCGTLSFSLNETVGILHRFWWWCVDYAEDGDLRKYTDSELSLAVGLNSTQGKFFVDAMVESGFIDRIPYFRVHDWLDYAGRYLEAKYRTANPLKLKKIRSLYKKKKIVCLKSDYRPTLDRQPNLTKPNLIKEKVKKEKKLADKPDDVSQQVWVDFLTHREGRRAAVTKTVIKAFTKEAEKAGINLEAALKECCSRGWQGFKAEWYLKDSQGGKYGTNKHGRKGPADAIAETFAEY